MSPLCCSSDTTPHLLALLLGDLLTLCSFLASRPLHLAYLFLFSPYLLPLLSFLSPLLLTTFFLLTLPIASPRPHDAPPSSPQFPGNSIRAVLSILKAGLDGEATVGSIEQWALMVFSPVDDARPCVVAQALLGDGVLEWDPEAMGEFCKNTTSLPCKVGGNPIEPGSENSKKSELFKLQFGTGDGGTADEAELISYKVAEDISKTKPESLDVLGLDSDASRHETLTKKPRPPADTVGENPIRSTSMRRREHRRQASEGLQRDGSMRKEKEWKRTLACKLYEERITFKLCEERTVADRGEEMDLLWEAYEDDANKTANKSRKSKEKKGRKDECKEELEEEEEEEDTAAQLCCLQALRLSAGKMNLGVGRPNLARVSKVLKGLGLFQSVSKRSSRKK